jgi:hypothetical protein
MERRACEIRAAFLSLPGQLSLAVATSELILPSASDLVVQANDVIERAIRSTVVINGMQVAVATGASRRRRATEHTARGCSWDSEQH